MVMVSRSYQRGCKGCVDVDKVRGRLSLSYLTTSWKGTWLCIGSCGDWARCHVATFHSVGGKVKSSNMLSVGETIHYRQPWIHSPVPCSDGFTVPSWRFSSNGVFTSRSAYMEMLGADVCSKEHEQAWTRLWKLPAPSRWLHFLWLVRRERILTNSLRFQLSNRAFNPLDENPPEG